MVFTLNANEVVLKAGDSNHLIADKKVRGKFIITNQSIYFNPCEAENPDHYLELPPQQIQEVMYFKTMGIIPNGLNVLTRSGESFRFIIKKRNEFGLLINKMY